MDRSGFEIAVIGMAGRFPGAADLEQFWQNLSEGVESIRFFSQAELEAMGRDSGEVGSDSFVPAHGVLDGYDQFDSEYFGFSPWEADVLDPQHRLFLECASSALEDSGYDPSRYSGLIGVYAGASVSNYLYSNVLPSDKIRNTVQKFQANYSNQADFLTTRVSYKLGLRGPSFTIQSACSTSLIAVHQACQQLLSGSCDIALAGGVSLTLPQNWGYRYEEGMILSPDGHCRAFDEQARGVLKGDGVGVVVLKRLADAIDDGDTIDAIILGSASNNDGDDKVGYSAPGINGQKDVIRSALLMADVSPDSIDYIEAHGTGTPVGDPIEISALTQVYREETTRTQYCGIGSVKTNIGHLDAAAGVAGLIKTVLALRHKVLPPSINFQQPSSRIDFANSPFYVNDRRKDWEEGASPRRAGVSSFGIGGSNAHVVLEEAPMPVKKDDNRDWWLFPLSARDHKALDEQSENLARYLLEKPQLALSDIALTLQEGRTDHGVRRVIAANGQSELIAALQSGGQYSVTGKVMESIDSIVFLFTGQGSQYPNMGRELYESDADFRADFDHCAEIITDLLDADIREIVYPPEQQESSSLAETLKKTVFAQPALFAIEYAVARRWIRQGVTPTAVIGHSLGEICAACIAGVFSLEEALKLVSIRGRSMQQMPAGVMSAIPLPESEIHSYLGQDVSLAAVNAPSLCVISGPEKSVEKVEEEIARRSGIECQRLHTSHAFHSQMMAAAEKPFYDTLVACAKNKPEIPIISTVTGSTLEPGQAVDNNYWVRNFRDTVRFSQAIAQVAPNSLLLEVGPGNTLITLAGKQHSDPETHQCVSSLPRPDRTINDTVHWLLARGRLWLAGRSQALNGHFEADRFSRLHLPTYPYQRRQHWIEPGASLSIPVTEDSTAQVSSFDEWFYIPGWYRCAHSGPGLLQQGQEWIVFSDAGPAADGLIQGLQQAGADVVVVRFSEHYSCDQQHFTVSPENPGHMVKLVEELTDRSGFPDHVLHCGMIDTTDDQGSGFWSLFNLAKALYSCEVNKAISLNIVASRSQVVLGNESVDPMKSTALGLLRVLPTEMPGISPRFIDVQLESGSRTLGERERHAVLAEITSSREDFQVALRNGYRWRSGLERCELADVSGTSDVLKKQGVYLITGGVGGIGLVLARFLAENFKANLVLLSRNADSLDEEQREKLRQISGFASSVEIVSADVSDPGLMEHVFEKATTEFGRVNGIFHTAGISGGGVIARQERERIEQVWSAKIRGTDVICETANRYGVDFVLLFSSLTSFVGFPGRAEYTAANLYLDAVAQKYYLDDKVPVISINWDTWSGIGMAAAEKEQVDSGAGRIDAKQGLEAMLRILQRGEPQVVVSTRPLTPQQTTSQNLLSTTNDTVEPAGKTSGQTDDNGENGLSITERTLCGIWEELLGVDKVDINDNFFELGGDSVVSIQLISRARQEGISLTTKQVFEHQTVAELASVAAGTISRNDDESTPQTGSYVLSPIQQWFFEQEFIHSDQWNLARWIKLPQSVDTELLSEVVHSIVENHGALRTRFFEEEQGLRQEMVPACEELFSLVEIEASDGIELQDKLDSEALRFQRSLDLDKGNLVRFVCVIDKGLAEARLLIVAHHLVMDLISLNLVVDDLKTVYQRRMEQNDRSYPVATASFRNWVASQVNFMASSEADAVNDYWVDFSRQQVESIPRDFVDGRNTVADAVQLTGKLTSSQLEQLLQRVGSEPTVQLQDVLLAALAAALLDWSGNKSACIDVEGHGRESMHNAPDVSRTVGWFTAVYPCVVRAAEDPVLENLLEQVCDARTLLPASGLGYGLSRYLSPNVEVRRTLEKGPQAEVVFLYQGHGNEASATVQPWQAYQGMAVGMRDPQQKRTHILEVNILRTDGLGIEIGYSNDIHRHSSIEKLMDQFLNFLRQYGSKQNISPAAGTKARSSVDLSLAGLSDADKAELQKILSGNKTD